MSKNLRYRYWVNAHVQELKEFPNVRKAFLEVAEKIYKKEHRFPYSLYKTSIAVIKYPSCHHVLPDTKFIILPFDLEWRCRNYPLSLKFVIAHELAHVVSVSRRLVSRPRISVKPVVWKERNTDKREKAADKLALRWLGVPYSKVEKEQEILREQSRIISNLIGKYERRANQKIKGG